MRAGRKRVGSRWVNSHGYVEVRIWVGGTPVRKKEHRIVMEEKLGMPLLRTEDVHHRNGIKTDNRPENLELVAHDDHASEHNRKRTPPRGYKMRLTDAERERRRQFMRDRLATAERLSNGRLAPMSRVGEASK